MGQTLESAPTDTGIVSQVFCKMTSPGCGDESVTKGVTGVLVQYVEEREEAKRRQGGWKQQRTHA